MATTLMCGATRPPNSAGRCWRRRPGRAANTDNAAGVGARLGPLCAGLDRQPPGPEQRPMPNSPADAGRGANRWSDSVTRISALEALASTARNIGRFEEGAAAVREASRWLRPEAAPARPPPTEHAGRGTDADLGRYAEASVRPRAGPTQPSRRPSALVLRLAAQAENNAGRPEVARPWPSRRWRYCRQIAIATERAFIHQALAFSHAGWPLRRGRWRPCARRKPACKPPRSRPRARFSCACAVCKANCCCAEATPLPPLPLMQALTAEEAAPSLPPLERTRALG